MKQKTIKNEISIEGKGLHYGQISRLTIKPAAENSGYIFKRTDLPNQPIIHAIADNVSETCRCTTISEGGASVATIEHLLSATYALGIDNILFEINGIEVPILTGNAKCFVDLYKKTEIVEQNDELKVYNINQNLNFESPENNISLKLTPSNNFNINVFLDFNIKNFPSQEANLLDFKDFENGISVARTFVFLSDIEKLLNANLIKGGDLNNAIVIIDKEFSQEDMDNMAEKMHFPKYKVQAEGQIFNNNPLHFPNEPARHKVLDLLGDLALIGFRFNAQIDAIHSGHWANTNFAKIIRNFIITNC